MAAVADRSHTTSNVMVSTPYSPRSPMVRLVKVFGRPRMRQTVSAK